MYDNIIVRSITNKIIKIIIIEWLKYNVKREWMKYNNNYYYYYYYYHYYNYNKVGKL